MRQGRLWLVAVLGLLLSCFGYGNLLHAAWAPTEMTLIAIKMTGPESLVIQNTSPSTVNLRDYLVQYYNQTSPSSFATPTESIQLPDFSLPSGQAILLNSDSALSCGAAIVDDLSFSLSDSAGYVRLTKVVSQPDGGLLYTALDKVSWITSGSGADLASTTSGSPPSPHIWYRNLDLGTWTKATLSSDCTVILSMVTAADTPTYVQWADGTAAPVTFTSLGAAGGSTSNKGLSAPQITELLPNPAEPMTDAEDEFIEIYNPNAKQFDLSGFSLEVGLKSKRKYVFPSGTVIPAKSFKAYSSEETGLALSNSGSQVWLVDSGGNVAAQSEPYGSSKSGQSWAAGNGKWYWTTTSTPNAANVINEPGGTNKSASRNGGGVIGASRGSGTAASGNIDESAQVAEVHPWTLAAVGSAAVLYGAYEYRNDLANNLHRLRRYREARRAVRH